MRQAVRGPRATRHDEPGDPVPLLDRRHGTTPLLRTYLRGTEAGDGEADTAAAWQRLQRRLEAPAPARRRSTAVCSALAAACLAMWLLAPPRVDAPLGLDAAGGAPGTGAPAQGGTEGAGGPGDRRPVAPSDHPTRFRL
jgi:hypothetical protein